MIRMLLPCILILAVLSGCASIRQGESLEYSMGAGVGTCETNQKDPSVFTGDVDDSDTCIQAIGRVHQSRHRQPIDNVQEKGDPIDAPSGPFFEVGYRDLGEVAFDGYYTVDDIQIEDTGTIETTAWHVSVGYTFPVAQRFALLALVGYSFWEVEENEIFGGEPYSLDDDGSSVLFGVGASYRFTRNWQGQLEWNRYSDVGGDVGEDDIDALLLSLYYRF